MILFLLINRFAPRTKLQNLEFLWIFFLLSIKAIKNYKVKQNSIKTGFLVENCWNSELVLSQRELAAIAVVIAIVVAAAVTVTTIAVEFIAAIIRQLRPSPLTTTKSIVTFAWTAVKNRRQQVHQATESFIKVRLTTMGSCRC